MITINGIDEALSNVPYLNRATLKSRLLVMVRNHYDNNADAYFVEKIDRGELIRTLWDLGDDPRAVRDKRRNFSSLKSSVNKDLRNLYENGRNPEGIILGPNNTFVMCSDAKDRILEHLADTIKGSETANLDQITKVLEVVNEILSDPNALPDSQGAGTQQKLDKLKDVLKSLSSGIGIAPMDDLPPGDQSAAGFDLEGAGELPLEEAEELVIFDDAEKIEDDEEPVEIDNDEELEDTDELLESDDLEELEEVEELEDVDDAEELEEVEELEDVDDAEELEEVEELEDVGDTEALGLPVDSLGQSLMGEESGSENDIDTARLLAEEFDGYLGTMDRFYNHFLIIPAGTYLIGSKTPRADEVSEKIVDLHTFYIGRFPVTNALFEIFVEKTGYRTTAEKHGYGTVYQGRYEKIRDPETGRITLCWQSAVTIRKVKGACWFQPSGSGSTLHNKRSHPVVQVSLKDAIAFAAWTGKRLPTEEEWESAARTSKGYVYPWGNDWKEDHCNFEESREGDTTPVDKYTSNTNELGIADTLGNVLEWTVERNLSLLHEKKGIHAGVAKGGSWVSSYKNTTLCSRFPLEPDFSSNILGFRCVAY